MKNLFTKTLYDRRWFILGWALGIVFFSWLIVIFYPSASGDKLAGLIDSIPSSMAGFVGNLSSFNDPMKYTAIQVFAVNLPLILMVFIVILAVGLTVGEESRGTLRTLLVTPLSRRRVLAEKWAGLAVMTFLAVLATGLGILLGFWQINEQLSWTTLSQLLVMLFLESLALASLIFGIGLATGRSGLTVIIGTLVVVESYIVTTFAVGVEWLKNWEWVSLFKYFDPSWVVAHGIRLTDAVVYLAIILVSLLVSWLIFRHRDIS